METFTINPPSRKGARLIGLLIAIVVILLVANPFTVIPAGHVGVKDFFGTVSPSEMHAGIGVIVPFTRVVKMSLQTLELKEDAQVPSKEGLIMDLEVSVLFRIAPEKADEIYRKVGKDFQSVIVEPQVRSAIREITASYEAKALYSAAREKVATEIFNLAKSSTQSRGIIIEQVLLRKINLPAVVANAIQEKLRREQEAEQMKFVLQKEQQEAERKRIEAQGISDFQRIVIQGISPALLEWKGIEATEKLATSSNTKVVIIGNTKNGLPVILGNDGK